ncbi:MAG: stalk domain-containing protein [Desulfocucumaceae bacterium]
MNIRIRLIVVSAVYLAFVFLCSSVAVAAGPAQSGGGPATPSAPPEINALFKIGDTSYSLNGRSMIMDAAPFIKDGRTYVPVRYVAGAAGIPDENISFKDGAVTIRWESGSAVIRPGSSMVVFNGLQVEMDVPVLAVDGRTYLPLRWICEAFGLKVSWDEENGAVLIQRS